jgi:large subunit ribosomal protein L23
VYFLTFGSHRCHQPNIQPSPYHIITMLRPKEGMPPWHASFKVPLHFNKLEFRDYLFHVYNVKTSSVRSQVVQPPPQRRGIRQDGAWYRPRSWKIMHVTLYKPFVWPEVPAEQDLEEFDKKIFDKYGDIRKQEEEDYAKREKNKYVLRDEVQREGVKDLARQARDLLSGKERWKSGIARDRLG